MRLLIVMALTSVALAGAEPARAGTGVERGDVLSILVLEDERLGREAKVNADGQIVLPQIGAIDVAGSTIDMIRSRIEAELARRDIILNPTVLVDVVQYRPFFVGGTVARPGAIAFEPGLTVRHAIVLAGGLEKAEVEGQLSPTGLDELRTRLRAGSYRLLLIESLIARLTAELERRPDLKAAALDKGLVPPREADYIQSLDSGLLGNRITEWTANQAHLKDTVTLLDQEIDLLRQQTALQVEERSTQLSEVETTRKLVEKGVVPLPRLQEMERTASRMSRDLLETEAFSARARQNRATAEHDLKSADTLWQIETQQKLREAVMERTDIVAELDVLRDKMLGAGIMMREDGTLAQPVAEAVIHRTTGGRAETITATLDSEIHPGDVVEIAFARRTEG